MPRTSDATIKLKMGNYLDLSKLMSKYPEVFILRRFSGLNVKNLLYYQAELAHLEQELEEIEDEDRLSDENPRKGYATNWKSLGLGTNIKYTSEDSGALRSPRDSLQWQTFLRLREVLNKYNEILTQQAILNSSLAEPKSADLKSLREWLMRKDYGDSFLAGKTEDVWDIEKGYNDYTTTTSSGDRPGGLTYCVSTLLVYLRRLAGSAHQPQDRVYGLASSSQDRVTNGLVTVISSICPVLPIVILFFIHDLLIRLGMILVFTAIFASIFVFGMQMRSDKVLAITTAFAAIQVVFVGGTHNGGS